MRRLRPHAVAIAQARMGSSRLPGKVLRPIAGRPLLWHVVFRLRRCRTLDAIVVATSVNPKDDPIADFCREHNVQCVRGSETDVLARFGQAAGETKAGLIVRVNADSPFIDPEFIDHMVAETIRHDGDYIAIAPGTLCAHEGVDICSRRALDKLLAQAPADPFAREHVTGYFKAHPDFARSVEPSHYLPLAHEHVRLSVDTPDDLAFVEAIYRRLEAAPGEASLVEVLRLLDREPSLRGINAHVQQKPLGWTGGTAIIRCDGGMRTGFGHIKRSLMLARALRDREGFGVIIAIDGDETACGISRNAGFETILLPSGNEASALATLVRTRKPDLLIADARENFTRDELARLADSISIVALLDDISDRRFSATHAYYTPLPQVDALSWAGAKTIIRTGWEWSVLGFNPGHYSKKGKDRPSRPTHIAVSMGGSDPLGFTRAVAKTLSRFAGSCVIKFVIGPGFKDPDTIEREIKSLHPAMETIRGADDLAPILADADLALITFGVTAYEAAAFGVPALYLALTPDHAISASAFEAAGTGRLVASTDEKTVAREVLDLLRDKARRRKMSDAGRRLIDGGGAERIAADLSHALAIAREKRDDAMLLRNISI